MTVHSHTVSKKVNTHVRQQNRKIRTKLKGLLTPKIVFPNPNWKQIILKTPRIINGVWKHYGSFGDTLDGAAVVVDAVELPREKLVRNRDTTKKK